jgi:RHS repeat-associated protein
MIFRHHFSTYPTAAYGPLLVNLQAALTDFVLSPDLNADPAGYPPNPIEYEEDCQEQFSNDPIEIERCLCLHFPAEDALQSIVCSSFEPVYWYHPDYLGHTDFVTDRTGQPYQHFSWRDCADVRSTTQLARPDSDICRRQRSSEFYAPFGEALLSQHTGTGYYNTPYRFNAKELDSETGLIYYGARYYEPKESVWLSVDPLVHKYPGLSGYNFVANNPIMLVDPDGRHIEEGSQEEWNSYKQKIQSHIAVLGALDKMAGTDKYNERISKLNGVLAGMNQMEDPNNPTVYRLEPKDGAVLHTYMNDREEVVMQTNGNISAFLHEVMHGIQYENNSLGFFPGTDNSINSFQNEIDAYSAQFSYSGALPYGINPNIPRVESIGQINKEFVQGIVSGGERVYNNLGQSNLNPSMNMDQINRSWPNNKWGVQPNETLRDVFPTSKWKN